jgi:neurotransmitter:Na+ symporter, NSS family
MKSQREHWGSRIGFILAAAGSAIGLGSLWRFPYMAGQSGGGFFVLLYLFFTFLIALPVFIGEVLIGRKSQKSVVLALGELSNGSNNWKLVGWFNILTTFLILSYYTVISGWCLNYMMMSINDFTHGKSVTEIANIFGVMYNSGDINLFWNFIFILLNAGVVYGGIRKGIEHWAKILTPALLFILIGLFIFSTTLPGFKDAAKFILLPDISKVTPSSILNALAMSFFTLSVGLGILTTYGSYMKPQEDMPKTGAIVASMTVLVSLFAALMIFPIIFSFGFEPQAGAGLVFKTLPILFAKLPGTVVISTIFFMLLVFTALTSSISLFEVMISNLIEVFPLTRDKAIVISAVSVFVMGIPAALTGTGILFGNWESLYGKDYFSTLDYLTGNWMMLITSFLMTIFTGWILDKKIAKEEFIKGTKWARLYPVWRFFVRYLAPVAIIIVILQEGGILDVNKLFN